MRWGERSIFPSHQNDYAAPPQPFDYEYHLAPSARERRGLAHLERNLRHRDIDVRRTSADFFMAGTGMGKINVVNATGGARTPDFRQSRLHRHAAGSSAGVATFQGQDRGRPLALHDITADAAMGSSAHAERGHRRDVTFNGGSASCNSPDRRQRQDAHDRGSAGSDPATKVTLGRVNDLDLTRRPGLAMLQVTDWQKGGGPTPSHAVHSLISPRPATRSLGRRQFLADLFLSGAEPRVSRSRRPRFGGSSRATPFTPPARPIRSATSTPSRQINGA